MYTTLQSVIHACTQAYTYTDTCKAEPMVVMQNTAISTQQTKQYMPVWTYPPNVVLVTHSSLMWAEATEQKLIIA